MACTGWDGLPACLVRGLVIGVCLVFSDTGLVYAWIYQPIPGLLVVFALALAKASLHVICPLVTRFDQCDTIVSCMATALTSVPSW